MHIETEHTNIPHRADVPSSLHRSPGLCTILDDPEVVCLCDAHYCVHAGWKTELVNDKNCLRALCNAPANRFWIKAAGVDIHVGKDGNRSVEEWCHGTGTHRVGGDDHLIAVTNVKGTDSGIEAGGRAIDRDNVCTADYFPGRLLQRLRCRPTPEAKRRIGVVRSMEQGVSSA